MFAAWVLSTIAAVFAGAGIKWAVDRIWPPGPRVLEFTMPMPEPGPIYRFFVDQARRDREAALAGSPVP